MTTAATTAPNPPTPVPLDEFAAWIAAYQRALDQLNHWKKTANTIQQKITAALLKTPGIQGVIAVTYFSLLTQVQSTNAGFFFVALKPWEVRKSKEEQLEYIQGNLQKQLSQDPDGIAFAFPPPSIPGLGTSGGVTMIVEDRSGVQIEPLCVRRNSVPGPFFAAHRTPGAPVPEPS